MDETKITNFSGSSTPPARMDELIVVSKWKIKKMRKQLLKTEQLNNSDSQRLTFKPMQCMHPPVDEKH